MPPQLIQTHNRRFCVAHGMQQSPGMAPKPSGSLDLCCPPAVTWQRVTLSPPALLLYNVTTVVGDTYRAMSVFRDLLRSTVSQGFLQPTVAFCNPRATSVASRPARWCCSHLSAHASYVTRPQHGTYKGSTSTATNCKLWQEARQT